MSMIKFIIGPGLIDSFIQLNAMKFGRPIVYFGGFKLYCIFCPSKLFYPSKTVHTLMIDRVSLCSLPRVFNTSTRYVLAEGSSDVKTSLIWLASTDSESFVSWQLFFCFVFLSWWGEGESKYRLKSGPSLARERNAINGVSLAGRWWPNIECRLHSLACW